MSEAKISEKRSGFKAFRSPAVLFDFDFNRSVKLRSQTPNVTANAGVLLLREIDHRLGITADIAGRLRDFRNPNFVRYPLAELLQERVYAFALGYSRQDNADIITHDPAFKTAVWEKAGCRVGTSCLAAHLFPGRVHAGPVAQPGETSGVFVTTHPLPPALRSGDRRVRLGVVDIDGFPIETQGEQPGAIYNGYYGKTLYSPLAAYFSPNGDFASRRLGEGFLHAQLRDGNAAPAEGEELFIDHVMDKAGKLARTVACALTSPLPTPGSSTASTTPVGTLPYASRTTPLSNAWRHPISPDRRGGRRRKGMNSPSN